MVPVACLYSRRVVFWVQFYIGYERASFIFALLKKGCCELLWANLSYITDLHLCQLSRSLPDQSSYLITSEHLQPQGLDVASLGPAL